MKTWIYDHIAFECNDDLSGDVVIKNLYTNENIGKVPGWSLVRFIAGWVAQERIKDLGDASPAEILGLKTK